MGQMGFEMLGVAWLGRGGRREEKEGEERCVALYRYLNR